MTAAQNSRRLKSSFFSGISFKFPKNFHVPPWPANYQRIERYLPQPPTSRCLPNHLSTLDSFIEIFSRTLYPLHFTPTYRENKTYENNFIFSNLYNNI